MARYKNKTKDLAGLFVLWLVQPSNGKGLSSTSIYAAAGRGEWKATCLLDYLLIWLLTTDDALRFENFSQWKATIPLIARDLNGEIEGLHLAQIEELANAAGGGGVKVFDGNLPLTDDSKTVTHPALDDTMFDLIILQQQLRNGLVEGVSDEEALNDDRELIEQQLEALAEYFSDTAPFTA